MFIPGWSDLVTGMNFIRDQEGRQSRKRHRCSHFASCQSSYQASGVTVDSSGRSSGHYCCDSWAVVSACSNMFSRVRLATEWFDFFGGLSLWNSWLGCYMVVIIGLTGVVWRVVVSSGLAW